MNTKLKKTIFKILPESRGDLNHIHNGKSILMLIICLKIDKEKKKLYIEDLLPNINNHNFSSNGYTALMLAAKVGYYDIVKILASNIFVDIYKFNKHFQRASHLARFYNHIDIAIFLENMEIKQKCVYEIHN
jgi:hypothetical protein